MSSENLIVYETSWIIKRIYAVSDNIRGLITDQTLFEERCIKRVGDYLREAPNRVSHRRYIETMIGRIASDVIKRNKNEHAKLFTTLSTEQEDAEEGEVEFDPEDVLANVESEVIAKEMAALLAQDDRRKSVVEAWTDGNTNTKSISRTLARTFGGNVESHRKFVQRFRNECHALLDAVI